MIEVRGLCVARHDLVPGDRVIRLFGRNRRRFVVRQRLWHIRPQRRDALGRERLLCADDLQGCFGTRGLAVELEDGDQCFMPWQRLGFDVLDAFPLARGASSPPLFAPPGTR